MSGQEPKVDGRNVGKNKLDPLSARGHEDSARQIPARFYSEETPEATKSQKNLQ